MNFLIKVCKLKKIVCTYSWFPGVHFRRKLYHVWSRELPKNEFGPIRIRNLNVLYSISLTNFSKFRLNSASQNDIMFSITLSFNSFISVSDKTNLSLLSCSGLYLRFKLICFNFVFLYSLYLKDPYTLKLFSCSEGISSMLPSSLSVDYLGSK